MYRATNTTAMNLALFKQFMAKMQHHKESKQDNPNFNEPEALVDLYNDLCRVYDQAS